MQQPEKSAEVLGAQYRMIRCLKNGNRDLAKWWMRVAADHRRCEWERSNPPIEPGGFRLNEVERYG